MPLFFFEIVSSKSSIHEKKKYKREHFRSLFFEVNFFEMKIYTFIIDGKSQFSH